VILILLVGMDATGTLHADLVAALGPDSGAGGSRRPDTAHPRRFAGRGELTPYSQEGCL